MGLFKWSLAETDNAQFANMSDFDSSKLDDSLYTVRENILKQSKKEQDNSQNLELDIILFDNFENKLLNPPEEELLQINSGSIEIPRQLMWARALYKPYPSQIIYSFVPILIKLLDNPSQSNLNLATRKISLNLAQFTSIHISQSHIYMVQILGILKFNVNNKRDDEPNILK